MDHTWTVTVTDLDGHEHSTVLRLATGSIDEEGWRGVVDIDLAGPALVRINGGERDGQVANVGFLPVKGGLVEGLTRFQPPTT